MVISAAKLRNYLVLRGGLNNAEWHHSEWNQKNKITRDSSPIRQALDIGFGEPYDQGEAGWAEKIFSGHGEKNTWQKKSK